MYWLQVLKALLSLLPNTTVKSVVADYEVALWRAVQQTMPIVMMHGCFFHYTQSIWRKV